MVVELKKKERGQATLPDLRISASWMASSRLPNSQVRKGGLPPLFIWRLERILLNLALLFSAILVSAQSSSLNVAAFDRARVLEAANRYLKEEPITITASRSPRSAGGLNDFFSEGDYWWPDPKDPNGPYIQKDGMSNPDNFVDHRRYLMRLSIQVPTLAAAWKLTQQTRYASHAAKHRSEEHTSEL